MRALYDASREAGIDFFDHADIYGSSPSRLRAPVLRGLRLSASERDEIVLQTKAGIVKDGPYFDFSYEHLTAQVEGSLRALDTEYIDILLLHRPDALVEPEEVARALDELVSSGKVRHVGVSNHTPAQIELLRRYVKQPFVANQLQLSITHAPIVAQGLVMNMAGEEAAVSRDVGVLDCRLHDITIQGGRRSQPASSRACSSAAATNSAGDRPVGRRSTSRARGDRHRMDLAPAQMQVVLGDQSSGHRVRRRADIVLTRAVVRALPRRRVPGPLDGTPTSPCDRRPSSWDTGSVLIWPGRPYPLGRHTTAAGQLRTLLGSAEAVDSASWTPPTTNNGSS